MSQTRLGGECFGIVADLYWGLAVAIAACAGAFVLGRWLSRRLPRRTGVGVAAVTLVALLAFIQFLWDHPLLTRLIPASNVIVLGNLQPPLSALLGGLAWGLIARSPRRKLLFVAPLLAISLWRGYGRLFEPVPPTRERWKGEVCRQTSDATCSAAAAVTLLRVHGIATTETEMARLSLTRRDGTTVLGRYRGLVLKTRDTPWRVEPVVSADLETLRRLAATSPVIISVGLPRGAERDGSVDPRYIEKYGWLPGLRHTVVVLGFAADGQVDIADPSVGRERWDVEDLRVLWQGNGFRLVRR
jgi:predicted double-glycine peptidase